LPSNWDHSRWQLKLDWVERQRVKEKMVQVESAQRELKLKRGRSKSPSKMPDACKTPREDAGYHPHGYKPGGTQRELIRQKSETSSAESQPDAKKHRWHPNGYWVMHPTGTQKNELLREKSTSPEGSQKPRPNGYLVATEVFHCLKPISCVDDIEPEPSRKNNWPDDAGAKVAMEKFKKQRNVVRVHDNKEFKGSWPHLNLTPSRPVLGKPQHRARNELYRSMALKMEEHIRTTLMFLPFSSLGSGLRIPPLGCLCKLSHLPDEFEVSPAAQKWAKISRDGWLQLKAQEEPLTQETFFCIRQIYDDACPVDVRCAVRNVHEKHWIWTTRLVVFSIKLLILQDLSHSPARLAEILEERLKPIHDFKTQEPKDVEVNVWMTSMAELLQMLRSLSLTQHLF